MDTKSRTASRITALILAVGTCIAFFGPSAQPRVARAQVVVIGADPTQEQMVDWAIRRYRDAGLENLPSLEYRFHPTREGCRGNLGYYHAGRVDVCTAGASEPYAKKYLLHEMAHAWTEAHVDAETRERFLGLQGITNWNDSSADWTVRGFEQTAEVIVWGIGEGEVAPRLPLPIDPQNLLEAYTQLTGEVPINPTV